MGSKTRSQFKSSILGIPDKLDRYALRSKTQIVIHVLASISVASLIYFLLRSKLSVPETYFVTITSSMSAASAALLAITIALGSYYSLNAMNWRDKLIDNLTKASLKTRKQMEKSAKQYPDISRQLAPLYDKSLFQVAGKPVDQTEIDVLTNSFLDWVRSQVESGKRVIDAGDVTVYDSFAMHLRDAIICEHQLSHSLRLLGIVRGRILTIGTFSSSTLSWVLVLILTLTFAILGSVGVLPSNLSFPLLVIPFWLFLMGGFALLKDITAVFGGFQVQETGFNEALAELNAK